MTSRCRAFFPLVLVLAAVAFAIPAPSAFAAGRPAAPRHDLPASEPRRPAPDDRRIRTTDARIRALIDVAVLASPSLRALVERVERSDVVVYVQCERYAPSRVAGRLTFISAAGGLRYVVVRLMRLESRAQQIALLAHELQHAVEIADTPAIVDGPTLAREYHRMGHVNPWSPTPGIAFDTTAAVDVGRQVLTEVASATGD
jgi:hypothetical protein